MEKHEQQYISHLYHVAYVMADAEYDVWLPNQRGNFYSRRNSHMDPDDPESGFWNFSWDDIGLGDYPPIYDYILEITKQPKFYVIAHSQGAGSTIALLTEKPTYNDRIQAMSLMAPATYFNNTESYYGLALKYQKVNDLIFNMFPARIKCRASLIYDANAFLNKKKSNVF